MTKDILSAIIAICTVPVTTPVTTPATLSTQACVKKYSRCLTTYEKHRNDKKSACESKPDDKSKASCMVELSNQAKDQYRVLTECAAE